MQIYSLKAVFFLAMSATLSGAPIDLTTDSACYPVVTTQWEFSEKPLRITKITDMKSGQCAPEAGAFQLRNGKTMLVMKPESEKVTATSAGITAVQAYSEGLIVNHAITTENGILKWTAGFENTSAVELWIEPSLRFKLKIDSADKYWDGFAVYPAVKAANKKDTLNDTFPLTALSNGKSVFALGTAPIINTSYLESGIDKKSQMYYGTRIVLPPGQRNSFEFVAFLTADNFGWRDAVNRYYRVFEKNINPAVGVDPRLGSGRYTESMQLAHYGGGINNPRQALKAGAAHAGLEWGFAMFHRQGDYYGRKELWNFPMTKGELKAMDNLRVKGAGDRSDRERFIQDRNQLFQNADLRGNIVLTFYIISYVEKEMAKMLGMEKYIYPEMVGIPAYRNAWGHRYCLSGHVFPWATPYEKLLRRDFPELVRDNNIYAFGYDCYADGDAFNVYRGELEYYLPGWSYDTKGKYIRRGLAFRHNADFIHSLKKNGRTVGLFGNSLPNALYGFSPDAFMIEGEMTKHMTTEGNDFVLRKRLFVGHKPLHLHMYTSNFNLADYMDWEQMTAEEIRLAYQDFTRDLISFCWKFGTIPSRQLIMSHEAVYKELPVFLDVTSRGYEPVPAVTGNEGIERTRYGAELGAVLVLSNRKRLETDSLESLDSRYLGNGMALLVDYRGNQLACCASSGKTDFEVKLTPMENKLISIPVLLENNSGTKVNVVSRRSADLQRIVCEFQINSPEELMTGIKIVPENEFELSSVILNGALLRDKQLKLRQGDNHLVIETRSAIFQEKPEQYCRFDWARAVIAVAKDADPRLRGTAVMTQDFIHERLKVDAAIVDQVPATAPVIVIDTDAAATAGERGIFIKDKQLRIRGRDAFDTQQMTWTLFRWLEYQDQRFRPPFESLTSGSEGMKKMMTKAGLLGKTFYDTPSNRIIAWNGNKKIVRREETAVQVDPGKLERLIIPKLELPNLAELTLDHPVWQKAVLIDKFKVRVTREEPTQKTEARVFVAQDAMYIRFQCHEENMNLIACEQNQRDASLWYDDDFEIRIAMGVSPEQNDYSYYIFIVNAKGVQADILKMPKDAAIMNEEGMVGQNYGQNARKIGLTGLAWNGEWTVKTRIEPKAWNGIIRIPLKTIDGTEKKIGRVNFSRYEKPNVEFSSWPATVYSNVDQPALFGVIEIK